MATNYPAGIDSLTNPGAGDALNSPSHAGQHANANDAIEAIETELGTNPSGSESTVAARLTAIESGARMGTGSVGATQLADNAVDTAAIADSAVTPAKLATTGRFVFPTGAANGYGFTSGAVHLSGTGAPEGVVTAAPGSTWLQTDATTDVKGWIRWVKATGTGNTGWVAGPEADTGWREVVAYDAGGTLTNNAGVTSQTAWGPYSGAALSVLIRRAGSQVSLRTAGSIVKLDGYNTGQIAGLPVGLRNTMPYVAFTVPFDGGQRVLRVDTGAVGRGSSTWATNDEILPFTISWYTGDAWPASLPGSAA